MRNRLFLLIFFFTACGDIVPVDNVNLCKGDNPPSNECAQCRTIPYAADCPRCRTSPRDADCADADTLDGGGGKSGQGGNGISGSGGKTGGSGGDAMISDGGGGGTGGASDGGSGGSEDVDAGPCGKCPGGKPKCLEDECVQCTGQSDCKGDEKQCDPDTHSCVACLENGDCGGDLKFCDPEAHECVQCLGNADCPSTGAPQCNDHECGGCSDNDACEDHDGKQLCDTETGSETRGECVECLGHDDCENPNPQCSSHECVPCTGNPACARRGGTTVCNMRANVETSGKCVECTGATETTKCASNKACNQSTGECTNTTQNTLTPCNKCQADSECVDGSSCVVQMLDDVALDARCFLINTNGQNCSVNQASFRPYSDLVQATSVDGTAVMDYCMPVTTCEAYLDANANKACDSTDDCGEGDGYCIAASHPLAPNKCSYICSNNYDCPNGLLLCDGPGLGKFCQPAP